MKMKISLILRSCVLFSLGLCHESALDLTYPPAPHIIVIMVDDLGWNDVSFHGSAQIPTPNIDALAYNGLILNRHYVMPSCTPTRAAFFTGKYPIRMGMQGQGIIGGEPRGLPLDVTILPEYLRDLGYTTKLIGKWHLGFHTQEHTPLHRGFDYFLGFYNSHVTYYTYQYAKGNMSGFDLHQGSLPAYDVRKEYATDLFTKTAVDLISKHDVHRPLYLQINHLGVHAPVEAPNDTNSWGSFEYITNQYRRDYAKMVTRVDDSVGQIVAALGDRQILKDSIIVFMTDNGAPTIGQFRNYGSNWPLRGTKYTLYEGGVRGVAAIWSPRLCPMADVSNNYMHITDWLPTLYSAAGGNKSDLGDIDGVDHWSHFHRCKQSQRKTVLLNIDEVSKTEAAINDQYKLIRGSYKRGYYDQHYGESGKYDAKVPEYNASAVYYSLAGITIKHHLGDPVTQIGRMADLRERASVLCRREDTFCFCNETECLFDIRNDPCEQTNIAKQYPKVVQKLNLYLEHYGKLLKKQPRQPIDWVADPRRTNNTWVPWLTREEADLYYYNSAMVLSTLTVSAHIGMALLIVGLRAFI